MTGRTIDGPWGYGTVTEYERYVSVPAQRAGMTETDWIVQRAFDAAYDAAAQATTREAAAA